MQKNKKQKFGISAATILALVVLTSGSLLQAKEQLRIDVSSDNSLLNEVRILDLSRDEKLKSALAQSSQRIAIVSTTTNIQQIQTTANAYSGTYFSSGLSYPAIEIETDLDTNWAVSGALGWVDDESVATSGISGSALVRAHVIPIQVDLRYSFIARDRRFVPAVAAGFLDVVWVQKSAIQEAQTSENYMFFKPSVRLDVRVWRSFIVSAYSGYLYPLESKYDSMKEPITGLGAALSI